LPKARRFNYLYLETYSLPFNIMHTEDFKLTIHIVTSLDGIIAKPDNSVAWFETADHYEKGISPTAQEMADFVKTIDCYIMGSRTYEHALELSALYGWAYGDTPTIVLTHRDLPVERASVELYADDAETLLNERLKPNYRNVWLVGGALLAEDFLRLKLADEIRLSIVPIILGEGKLFFDQIGHEHRLHLKDVTAYKNGMVELQYEILK
jgi:dihydrofolate reductase